MASLVRLKQEIQFNARLGTLLEALKSIAAQQFQALERTFRAHAALFEAARAIAGSCRLDRVSHPFTRGEGPIGVIVVTSDTGLLGGLNQQVVTTAVQEYRRNPGEFIVIGERGTAYVRERGFSCRAFPGVVDTGRRGLAVQVRDYALGRVLSGQLGALTIVYPRALSFTLQRVELLRVVPCGAWLEGDAGVPRPSSPVLVESSLAGMLEYLTWLWVGQQLYDVFGMSRLAELAARSVHLEGSAQELQRRGKKLQMRYFRERHEVIDRSMRELFAGRAVSGRA
jgi:ATP synthase F1 gamma subunit